MGFRGDRYGLTWGWGGYRSAYIKMGMPMYTTSMIRWVETITRATWFIYVYMELYDWLVVWNIAFMTFHSVGNFIIPTDELIFFRGVGQPPSR